MTHRAASVAAAETALRALFEPTPLLRNDHLSDRYSADIWLKREDLTPVRSYKLRGAFNAMRKVMVQDGQDRPGKAAHFVCASAGNHAQGVAAAIEGEAVRASAPGLKARIIAALDALFGGLRAALDGIFDDKVFVVSFLSNVVVAAFIVFLGDQLGVGSQLSTGVVVGQSAASALTGAVVDAAGYREGFWLSFASLTLLLVLGAPGHRAQVRVDARAHRRGDHVGARPPGRPADGRRPRGAVRSAGGGRGAARGA